jgi:hypothetical protein
MGRRTGGRAGRPPLAGGPAGPECCGVSLPAGPDGHGGPAGPPFARRGPFSGGTWAWG